VAERQRRTVRVEFGHEPHFVEHRRHGIQSLAPFEAVKSLHGRLAMLGDPRVESVTEDIGLSDSNHMLRQVPEHLRFATREELVGGLARRVAIPRLPDLDDQHLRYSVVAHKRIALSFASFFFALIGAPLGIYFRRGGRMVAFFISFLIVLVVYYPLLLLGEAIATDGRLPAPAGAWLGNAMIAGIGVFLLIRVFRE